MHLEMLVLSNLYNFNVSYPPGVLINMCNITLSLNSEQRDESKEKSDFMYLFHKSNEAATEFIMWSRMYNITLHKNKQEDCFN